MAIVNRLLCAVCILSSSAFFVFAFTPSVLAQTAGSSGVAASAGSTETQSDSAEKQKADKPAADSTKKDQDFAKKDADSADKQPNSTENQPGKPPATDKKNTKDSKGKKVCTVGTKRVDFHHVDATGRPAYVPEGYKGSRSALIHKGKSNTQTADSVRVNFDRTTGMASACLTEGLHTYAPSAAPGINHIEFSKFDHINGRFVFRVSATGRVTLGEKEINQQKITSSTTQKKNQKQEAKTKNQVGNEQVNTSHKVNNTEQSHSAIQQENPKQSKSPESAAPSDSAQSANPTDSSQKADNPNQADSANQADNPNQADSATPTDSPQEEEFPQQSPSSGAVSLPGQTVTVTESQKAPGVDIIKIVDDAVAVTFLGKYDEAGTDPLLAKLLDGVQFDLQNAAGTKDTKTRHGRTVYLRFGSYAIAALRGEPFYLPQALKFVVRLSSTNNFVVVESDQQTTGTVTNPATINLNLQLAPAGGSPSILKPLSSSAGQSAAPSLQPPVLLAKNTRYTTAVRVAEEAYTKAQTVFVASGESYPDALAAGPAAKVAGAPFLLTLPDKLPDPTANAIRAFGAKEVVIVGGESAVSAKVEKEIAALGLSVSRVSGKDRIATALALADKYFPNADTAFVAYGWDYPDALSASSVGALNGWPVLLTDASSSWSLAGLRKYKTIILVGGTAKLPNPTDLNNSVSRVSGVDRFETSLLVAKLAEGGYAVKGVVAAYGNSFPDALVASQLATKGVAVLLADKELSSAQTKYLRIVKTRSDLLRYVVGALAFRSPHILA